MIAAISKKLSLTLLKSNAINQEELNVYAYGIQLLILSVIDWSITFLLVFLIGEIYLSATYFFVFFILRRHCGGYHAETHIQCIIVSNIVYVLSVLISANMRYENFTIPLFLGELINLIILHKLSPIEHPNKPISKSEIMRHKKWGRILNMLFSIAAIGINSIGISRFACIILTAQLSVSIAVVLQKIKNQKRKEEKTDE